MHVLMFWGFLMLASDMFDLATANAFSTKVLPDSLNGPWNGMVEFGPVMDACRAVGYGAWAIMEYGGPHNAETMSEAASSTRKIVEG